MYRRTWLSQHDEEQEDLYKQITYDMATPYCHSETNDSHISCAEVTVPLSLAAAWKKLSFVPGGLCSLVKLALFLGLQKALLWGMDTVWQCVAMMM